MDWDVCNQRVFDTINEYLIIEEQNKELLEILIMMDMISIEEGQYLIDSLKKLKESLEVCKTQLIKGLDMKERVCDGYRVLNLLMDLKDIDDRIFELLENKLQFPMEEKEKKLLQYFTCDAGIRILFNTKTRYLLNSYIFSTMSKGQGC